MYVYCFVFFCYVIDTTCTSLNFMASLAVKIYTKMRVAKIRAQLYYSKLSQPVQALGPPTVQPLDPPLMRGPWVLESVIKV